MLRCLAHEISVPAAAFPSGTGKTWCCNAEADREWLALAFELSHFRRIVSRFIGARVSRPNFLYRPEAKSEHLYSSP